MTLPLFKPNLSKLEATPYKVSVAIIRVANLLADLKIRAFTITCMALSTMPLASAEDSIYQANEWQPSQLFALQSTPYSNLPMQHASIVQASELMASEPAKRVLRQARVMTLNQRVIVGGGCWDYLNMVFSRATVGRDTVLKGSYEAGPYASREQLRSGDWLYFINHGYNDVEHSGLFIGWVEPDSSQALILSYAGENRQEPARYKVYDLSHVYNIIRPI